MSDSSASVGALPAAACPTPPYVASTPRPQIAARSSSLALDFSAVRCCSRRIRTASTASTPSRISRAHSIRPYVVPSVVLSRLELSRSSSPLPAAYGPWRTRPRIAPAVVPHQPYQISLRARGSVRPAGQHSTTKTSPPSSTTPRKPTNRATSKILVITPLVPPPTTEPVAATSGPSPTTNAYAPAIGCESAEVIR